MATTTVNRVLLLLALPMCLAAAPVNYDIVYVRAPRSGDSNYIRFPDVFFPTAMPPGSDLILLHPDGTEETLFAAGKGAVLDPAISFDAQWVFFSYIPDVTSAGINPQRGLAYGGADIYKIHMGTRQVTRLTQQVWTPPTGSANWSTNLLSPSGPNTVYLGFGTFNLGACPLPGGKVMFVSSRDGYMPNKAYTNVNMRLYIMDEDGRNVEPVGHLNIGSALHPTVLMDGRVMFASFEGQGVRDQRNWSVWSIWPDGRVWEPLLSAMNEAPAFHFQTQLGDGRLAVTWYYNLNDNGFGSILAFYPKPAPGTIPFGSPNANNASNPAVRRGLWPPDTGTPLQPRYTSFPFSPQGLTNLTGFSHGEDGPASYAQDGGYAGKATHPSGAPNNDMLLVWTPGPAYNNQTPYYDAGIYILPAGQQLNDYRQLVKVKNSASFNELQPKALVPYSAIYGIAQPAQFPYLPNDGSVTSMLPAGTPFGLVGTSSFYNRDTTPAYGSSVYNGLDPFNTDQNGASPNWSWQGADAGKYTNADIFAVRIVALEGVAVRSYPNGGDPGFLNHADKERLRILGEIPLRKTGAGGQPILDAQGNPDTSFLAKLPADTPFTFQTLDRNGLVLNMAQTWHMVRPGEVRNDCGGCHAHSKPSLNFAGTAASQASYQVADLTTRAPLLTKDGAGNTTVKLASGLVVDVEYYRDIKPILQRSCVPCHSKAGSPAAGLILDDTTLVNGYDGTFHRLANDWAAQWGIPPVIGQRQWRQTNTSRYVRAFQSRRSLLAWKVFGQRLDGWANGDHPTESTPGAAGTLPPGSDSNMADIDYTGTIMPPPNSGVPALSEDEKMTIARWIDLGAPITAQGDASYKGYFADEIKPTVALSSPRSGVNGGPLSAIRVGLFDAYSGINLSSLSVTTNFAVNGNPAGAELGPGFAQTDPSVWTLALGTPISSLSDGHIVVRVKDGSGNWTTVDRWFSIGAGGPPPAVTVTPGSVTLPASGTQQFTAAGGPVVWSISPVGVGTITSGGLYTAPGSVGAQQTVTVKAASSADANVFATATVTLLPPVTVTPPSVTLSASGSQQFTAAGGPVVWSISPVGVGTITAGGLYTAPGSVGVQQTVTVKAASSADANVFATATVTLLPPVTVTPPSVTLSASGTQQFTAAGLPVVWSISPLGAGTITAGGLYTAPGSVGVQQAVTVKAASSADANVFATATVALVPPVMLTPPSVTLSASGSQQFTAAGGPVVWSISPVGVGTITSGGLYTAPGSIGSQQTVTVRATSSGDANVFATATVTLVPPVMLTPPSVTLSTSGAQQFTATGGPVVWSISPVGVGTITSGGLYTAPGSVASQQTVTVKATSSANANVFATSTVTLVPPATFHISGSITPMAAGSGTTLQLNTGGTATADSSGNFSFAGLANGTYTITPSKSGYSFTPSSRNATVNGGNVTGVTFTGQAVGTSAAIATDAIVWRDGPTASSTITTAAFSTTRGNELLLAFIATDYRNGANTTVKSVTGAGLNWVLVARTNVQAGTSEVWRAFASSALTNVTVKATLSQSVVSSLTVATFSGVDTSGNNGSGAIGRTASGNKRSGAPTASLVTSRNDSWVWGVGNDYDNPIPRTPGPGQSLVHQSLSTSGDTYWVQRRNSTTPASGTTVTVNDTAPASDRYNLTIVEILAAR